MLVKSEHNGHILEHDEEAHLYLLDGKLLTGVTTILSGGYPISRNVIDWQIKAGAKWICEKILTSILTDGIGWHFTDEQEQELVKESLTAYKIALEEAAEIGTIIHEYAYCVEAKKEFDLFQYEKHKDWDAIQCAANQFNDWKLSNDDEIVALEELVCSPSLNFAGRFDRLALRDGSLVLTDYKTSGGFYITQFIQLAAYTIAIEEWLGKTVNNIEIVRFDKKSGKLSSRDLRQLANTVGLKPETTIKRLKKQFTLILETYKFKQKFDKYIKK